MYILIFSTFVFTSYNTSTLNIFETLYKMSKSKDVKKKADKKAPAKNLKEKRAAKETKRQEKKGSQY